MIAATALFLIGAPAAAFGIFGVIAAALLHDSTTISGSGSNAWVVALVIGIIGIAVWIPCMIVDISREHDKAKCRGNHEVLVRKNDTLMYNGRTVIMGHETCMVFIP